MLLTLPKHHLEVVWTIHTSQKHPKLRITLQPPLKHKVSLNKLSSNPLVRFPFFHFKHHPYITYELSKPSSMICNTRIIKIKTHSKQLQLDSSRLSHEVSIHSKHSNTFHKVHRSYPNHQITSGNTLTQNSIFTLKRYALKLKLLYPCIINEKLDCHCVSAYVRIINPQSIVWFDAHTRFHEHKVIFRVFWFCTKLMVLQWK